MIDAKFLKNYFRDLGNLINFDDNDIKKLVGIKKIFKKLSKKK